MWCRGCYVQHTKDNLPKSGKELGGYWEVGLEGRYDKGRMGYHVITHFQCNFCHFRNMKERDPTERSNKDERLIISIKRVSLDAFWSIEPGMVRGDLTTLRKMVIMTR